MVENDQKRLDKETNAMRMLDAERIHYEVLLYTWNSMDFDGEKVAVQVGLSPDLVYKTLVTIDEIKQIRVCCLPVDRHWI